MAEGVAARAQLRLHLRAVGAGAEGGDLALLVEVEQLGHALQRQGQHRLGGLDRVDMAGHRGAATVGDDDGVLLPGPGQQLADLRGGFRQGDTVGEHAELAGTHGQPVRQALAAGVAHAHFGIDADQRMTQAQARFGHLRQYLFERGILQALPAADQVLQEGRAMRRQLHHGGLVAPSIPTSHACSHYSGHSRWLPILASRPRRSLSDRASGCRQS